MLLGARLSRKQLLRGIGYATLALGTSLAPGRAAALDPAQERQIGQQVYGDMRAKGLILDQSPYYAVLRSVGQRISRAAGRHWFPLNFIIIQGNQANAFSAPGGDVYVNEGLLRSAENVDELANVLGHETAHLVLGHVSAKLTQQHHLNVFSRFAQMFARTRGSQNTVGAANIVAKYGFLNFTRTQEYQADQEGARLAARAGYNPWGTVWFFQEVERLYGDSGFEQYVQQHPSTDDRVKRITTYLQSRPSEFRRWNRSLTSTNGLPLSSNDDRLVLHS